MRKLILTGLIIVTALTACEKKATDPDNSTPCAPKACTMEFRSVGVKFVKSGQGLAVQNFKAVNKRTGQQLKNTGIMPNADQMPGYYIVASDNNLKELSDAGDEILVSATDPATNVTKTATFKIAGGCACHVAKTSGPEEVVFE
ncbi:hypothetical protein [Mucilaginibacter myungsuensis]|uniref:Uncharacterized protein n=1 Tax=Mucilaginibacter myungsuensis TaxID=649104 RepID=A0A929KZ26_9SPHI|nr:hypothetical protein [Mucilaginibacter myungsuensis]MBE9664331.1 hypothetical protein [Mucilaginibacter myungsuensis]MDN3597041.1 hypothetical protein [Mucilaginibacter myungsuensis]